MKLVNYRVKNDICFSLDYHPFIMQRKYFKITCKFVMLNKLNILDLKYNLSNWHLEFFRKMLNCIILCNSNSIVS